ncbi:hypothetical protein SY88_20645 [Clostridiales bacterium PH28_bin88]|nr:hypothetical protein SY88_20645 [Clostridiales bacterium PH28_bin88]
MEHLLVTVKEANRNQAERLTRHKTETGQPVMGYLCTHVPEELIYAAGFLPTRVTSRQEEITDADSFLQSYVCSFARSCLDQGLKGHYKYLDGLVGVHSCDTIRGIYGIWKRNIPMRFTAFLGLPIALDRPEARELVRQEFKALRRQLEEYTGKSITDESIRKAISIYNKNRRLLAQVAALRSDSARFLSGGEFLEVVNAGFSMPKEEHSALLRQLLTAVKNRKEISRGKVRVLVSGSVMDDALILQLVEETGGAVVADDLCTGSRYFSTVVSEEGDPLEALVDHYFQKIFCACKFPFARRKERLLRLVDEYHIQGVILLLQKFCDPHFWDLPALKAAFEERGIPLQLVEYEHRVGSPGVIKNRIQSLIEMIGG